MNPEKNNEAVVGLPKEKHPVFQVTKLSKYLAMIIFIVMPFVGGWIGYTYVPVKIIEVEKTVYRESVVSADDSLLPVSFADSLYVGQKIGAMTLSEYGPYNSSYSEMSPSNIKMLLKGPVEITGVYEYYESEIGFEGYCMKEFSPETKLVLPYVPVTGEEEKAVWMFCFRNEAEVSAELGKTKQTVTLLIDNYELNAYPSEIIDRADFVGVVK